MNLIEQINNHKYLYLDKLVEINDLELEVYLSEGRVDSDTKTSLQDILKSAPSFIGNPIISDESCKGYKLLFQNYITYSVLNESFSFWDEQEVFEGNIIRKYTESNFIKYVKSVASPGYLEIMNAEDFSHFGICCLNHIIDVACLEEPIIEELILR